MTPRQWLALMCFYVLYLFFGAVVFYCIEHKKELQERAEQLQNRIKVNELLVKFASPEDKAIQNKVLATVSDYCGRPVTNYTLDEYPEDYRRTFYHSFWFSFIVCSTLGYGSSSPHDQRGQAFLIFYALIGIPVTGFVLTYLGDVFSKKFIGIYKRYKGYEYPTTENYAVVKKFGMIGRIIMFLIPGIAIFIFLPACLFSYFEDWPYVTSVYYAFITLTTIGFGDYVPTFQNGQARKFGIYFTFYQIFIIFWNIIGAGYFVMIIGFIAKGMQSKRIARLEHQLALNFKATQNRIWTGVTKDLSFLRRILNEVNLMKFKPVYTDSTENITFHSLTRSLSCPELTMYRLEHPIRLSRKRTCSENYGQSIETSAMTSTMTLNRVQSEGDLSRIDKKETFKTLEASTLGQTKDLLSNIITALSSIELSNEDELSNSQMWTCDRTQSRQSLAQSDESLTNRPVRKRAFSDFYIPQTNSTENSNKLMWNGNNDHQIQEYFRNRPKKFSIESTFPSISESTSHSRTNRRNTLHVPTESRYRSFISKINPFKAKVIGQEGKRYSVTSLDPHNYLNKTAKGRESQYSLSQSAAENMELLEKTTIADLIRAIEGVQAKSNISSANPFLADYRGSVRSRTGLQVSKNVSSRRGSLRPIPKYTTVFTSENMGRHNNSSNLDRESAVTSPKTLNLVNPTQITSPHSAKRISSNAPHNSPSPQVLRRTFSLRPSPLAVSPQPTSNVRVHPETPIITVQPPNVMESNVLWQPESTIKDRNVEEKKNMSK